MEDNTNKYEQLINTYIEYYRKTFPENDNMKNMFDNINYNDPTCTNHIMEMFYTDILKHNKINNDIYIDVNDIDDIDDIDELYGLKIENNLKYISQSVISLIHIIIDNNYKNWIIFNLK
jgi:predicted transcriptional regulator